MSRSLACLLRSWVPVLGWLLAACSSDDGSSTATTAATSCAPGKVEACPCPGSSTQGTQTCKADGSGFGACTGCPGAGGASGSSGQSGAAGATAGQGGEGGQGNAGGVAGQGGAGGQPAGAGGQAGSGGASAGQGGAGAAGAAGEAGQAGNGGAAAGAGGSAAGAGGSAAGAAGSGAGAGGSGQAPLTIETCEQSVAFPSNEGCEFWAVDLDQQDGFNDPASAPWGLVVTATSKSAATVVIEINEAAQGKPAALKVIQTVTLQPGETQGLTMPTRELDCGVKPNDYASPGTCLSSAAVRVTSDTPITVQQFNAATNSYSNDASMLLPTPALGRRYHVIGWGAGHPVPVDIPGVPKIIDRAYVTIVGVEAGTQVTVTPSARIRGNGPIPKTQPGGTLSVTLGPFDVLNLETDDFTQAEADATVGANVADLTGTVVKASKPVAVFSGVESAGVPGYLKVPTPPGWSGGTCCLDHLEEQLFPLEAAGKQFIVTRSPVRSTGGTFAEADVLRFVGGAADATVTTSLPAPFDSFVLKAGEVKDTWTQDDVVVSATAPIQVGQLIVSGEFIQGKPVGDPSLLLFAPVEQFRRRYPAPMPVSWESNHVVIAARSTATITVDGQPPGGCVVEPAGVLEGNGYVAMRCKLPDGPHFIEGDEPFGLSVYGYGETGSYAYNGGARLTSINPLP